MPDMGAGITLYAQSRAVATLSLSPLVPNAAVVRRVILANASAADTWVIRTNGQEVGRFWHDTASRAVLLPNTAKAQFYNTDIFEYCSKVLGVDLIYPIPEGKTLTMSSIGGATADIAFEYEEFASSALNPSLVNYPGGTYWLAPAYGYLTASVTTAGEKMLDTEINLDFVPDIFTRTSFPTGWTARVLDLYTDAGSVNKYASSTDHISRTTYLAAQKSGQRLFTRSPLGGIPLIAADAAAGSANTSTTAELIAAPNFVSKTAADIPNLDAPLLYRPGYVYEWLLNISGDVTGGADYSFLKQVAIVEYRSN